MTELEAEQQIKADADTLIIVAARLGITICPVVDCWLAIFQDSDEDSNQAPRGVGDTPLEALAALTKAYAT